jgi:elongation factor P
MLTINDLKPKMVVLIDDEPYQILEVAHQHIGRGGSSVQTRVKNLITGAVLSRNYKPSDTFEEADIEKRELLYLYGHRGEYVFTPAGKPQERFTLSEEQMADAKDWLKANTPVTALFLEDKLLNITAPIKVDLKIVEAPPSIRGDTATGGTKTVVLETGAKVQAPLFVNEGDVIRINTETGTYVERVEKGK